MLKNLLLCISFIPLFSLSKTIDKNIEGNIVNTKLEPLPNATIKIIANDSNGIVKQFAFCNAEGKFAISVPTAKQKLYLQISAVGYITYNVLISDSIFNLHQQYILQPQLKELPEVHVIADRAITKRGDTTSFKVSAFAKGNEDNIADLLKKLPGFKIDETGSMSFNGKYISAVLVEDDDLFGRSYGKLINNASVNGIEKVEVIENYKDISKIENTLNGGKQTVVNLKYKKLGIRNFGNLQIGYAPSSNLIDAKFSNTTLSKRVKGITLGNKNQIGFLAQKLYGLQNENSLPYNNNIQFPTSISNITSPIGIVNIQPININNNRIFDNNSNLISTNLLIKPSKKIVFKNNYAFVNDNFVQNYKSTTTYLNSVISTVINKQNNITKTNQYFFSEGELSINWKENQQTRAYFFVANSNNNHLSNGFFQVNPLKQTVQNVNKQVSAMLTHIFILNANSYLNVNYAFHKGISKSNYTFNNPLVDSVFKIISTAKQLVQNLTYDQKTHFIGATWFKKINKIDISIAYTSTFKNILPINDAFVMSNNIATPLPNDFLLKQQIIFNENELSFNFAKEFNKTFKVDFSTKLKNINYKYGVIHNQNKESEVALLPSFSIAWNLKNNQTLSLNSSLNVELPRLEQLNKAMIFTGFNAISSGTNSVNIQQGYEVGLYYRFYDPTNKKIILNINANYNNTPNIYNDNFTGRGLYAFYQLTPFYNNNNDNFYVQFELEKNLVRMKSWVKFKLNPHYYKSLTSTNDILTSNKSISLNSELRFNTNWSKWFNINTAVVFAISKQQSIVTGFFENNFSSNDWLTNTTIELKLNENFFIDIQHDYVINKPFNQPQRTIQFLDVKCRYNINKKWHSNVLLRNMLNTNNFSTNNISATQSTIQNFALTPILGLVSVGYKF